MEQSSTSPAANNAIRGAEQSGNIAKKLGRQEWNKTPGIRPSLPPFTKYIGALIKIRYIVISQHNPVHPGAIFNFTCN